MYRIPGGSFWFKTAASDELKIRSLAMDETILLVDRPIKDFDSSKVCRVVPFEASLFLSGSSCVSLIFFLMAPEVSWAVLDMPLADGQIFSNCFSADKPVFLYSDNFSMNSRDLSGCCILSCHVDTDV